MFIKQKVKTMTILIENKTTKILKNLQNIYGVGRSRATALHKRAGLNLRVSSVFLKKKQEHHILKIIARITTGSVLLKHNKKRLEFLYDMKAIRGLRNRKGLPSRGQQTRTNAKTKQKLKG